MTTAKNCNECQDEKVQGCTNCCKTCPDCPHCYDLDSEKLREYICAIDNKICEYSESLICISNWGYGCKNVTESDFKKLTIFKDYLQDYYNSVRFGYNPGVCPDEVQNVLEATANIVDLNFKFNETFTNVRVDNSNYDQWVSQNPYCVAWEDWEKFVAKIAPKVGITVTNVSDACKFIFDFKTEYSVESYEFLYALSVAYIAAQNNCFDIDIDVKKLECDIQIEVEAELKKCEVKYQLLIDKLECDLSFDAYVSLIKCSLSHEVIVKAFESGVPLDYIDGTPVMRVSNQTYPLDTLSINLFDDSVDSSNLKTLIGDQTFDRSLIDSYSNSDLIKVKIDG